MIIEEVWNCLLGIIVCIIYPLVTIFGVCFTFIDSVYQTIYSSIQVVMLMLDVITEFIDVGLTMIVPAPYIVVYSILLLIIVANFLKRRIGEISVAGFRFGGG